MDVILQRSSFLVLCHSYQKVFYAFQMIRRHNEMNISSRKVSIKLSGKQVRLLKKTNEMQFIDV